MMNKEALASFLSGKVTPEAANLFKKVASVDGKIDVRTVEQNIGNGNVRVASLNEMNEPVPLDVVKSLISGKKGALDEAKSKNKTLPSKYVDFKNTLLEEVEKPVFNKLKPEVKTTMTNDEIKDYIKETVYDYIINEALSKKKLKNMINEILKEDAKTYLKEALIELKTQKK